MELDLRDRTALVVAASRGIGEGVASVLAREGANLVIASSNAERLEDARKLLADQATGTVDSFTMDVRSLDDVKKTAEGIHANHEIDILVTNGPGPPPIAALEMLESQLREALDVHVRTPIALCRVFVPGMIRRGYGRVILLASSTAKEPDEGMVLSNTARAALVAYGKTLAREVGSHGVTVNSILTGSVLTARSEALMKAEASELGQDYEEYLSEAAQSIPAGYIASPEQFAETIAFLASPRSSYVNGVSLPIDGGYMRSL